MRSKEHFGIDHVQFLRDGVVEVGEVMQFSIHSHCAFRPYRPPEEPI